MATISLSASACDLFESNADETPTSPLLANVVLVGDARVQTDADGFAGYLGQVANIGGVTARNVRVSVNVRDADNNLLDVASTTAVPANLAARQTGTFLIVTRTPTAQAVNFNIVIEWD